MIRSIYWKIRFYFTDNFKYLEKFRKTNNINDLKQYIIKSSSIDGDIEEIVKWNRYYGYTVDNEHYHCHTFKQLLLEIIFLYEEGHRDFVFDEENFHEDELKMLSRFLDVLKEVIKWD